ncbi:hypothetical protein GQ457_13G011320 [Hibiscus cannabinus]
MDEGSRISDHLSALNHIATELETIGVKIDDEDKAMRLILSLPTSYEHMKPILMYGKETMDFAEIASKLISEERRLKNGGRDFTVRDSTDSVLAVNEKRKKNVEEQVRQKAPNQKLTSSHLMIFYEVEKYVLMVSPLYHERGCVMVSRSGITHGHWLALMQVINQRKYILDLLQETGLLGCKPVDTPMEPNLQFGRDEGPKADKEQFQRLVGKLIYLSLTRPDIAFPVNLISQHMTNPTEAHMVAATRILRYLKKTPGHGLIFRKTSDKGVKVYTDSSWAGDLQDRSISGYCTFVWGNLVTWRSKKQAVVSRSSAEAEFRALALGLCEGMWLLKLLKELTPSPPLSFELLCDNQSAIQIAKNPVQHDRTKHVEIDRHFIAEKLKNKTATLSYIPSAHQLADIFTKALPVAVFSGFLSKLGIYNVYSPACGGV